MGQGRGWQSTGLGLEGAGQRHGPHATRFRAGQSVGWVRRYRVPAGCPALLPAFGTQAGTGASPSSHATTRPHTHCPAGLTLYRTPRTAPHRPPASHPAATRSTSPRAWRAPAPRGSSTSARRPAGCCPTSAGTPWATSRWALAWGAGLHARTICMHACTCVHARGCPMRDRARWATPRWGHACMTG